ncbi:hypothetical protein HZS_7288, partial [Henneguya salminicola]
MNLIRSFLKDFLGIFQREGTYVTVSSFGMRYNLLTHSSQFVSKTEISSVVDKLKGVRTQLRNTGQALMETRRKLNSADPNYPLIILLLLNGPSSDDYRVPSMVIREDGIKVIVLVNGRSIPDQEVLRIQSSTQLSFRTNFMSRFKIISSLIPLFKSICGSRDNPFSREGKIYMSQRSLSQQWGWKTFGSPIQYRKIAETQIATILDTTNNPDSIIRLYYNIIKSFSIKSRHSIQALGLTDISALRMSRFRQFQDSISMQLLLNNFLGNSVRYKKVNKRVSRTRRVPRLRRQQAIRRRPKRDIFEDLFSSDTLNTKRQNLGSQQIFWRPLSPRLSRIGTNPSAVNSQAPLLNSNLATSRRKAPSNIPSSQIFTPYASKPNYLGQMIGFSDMNSRETGFSDGSDLSSQRKLSDKSTGKYSGLSGGVGSRKGGSLGRGMRRKSANPLGSASPVRLSSSFGQLPRKLRAQALRQKQRRNARRVGQYGRLGGRISIWPRRIIYYRRTWSNLAYRCRRIYFSMKRSSLYTSYGPNKNKLAIIVLAGWPYHSNKFPINRTLKDAGFTLAARRITSLGVRLVIIVMQSRKTLNRFAQPILRAASTYFLHGTWGQAQNSLARFQRSCLQLLGDVGTPSYSLKYVGFQRKKKFGFSIIPTFGPILPPPYETYMTTNYLTNIQNLRRTPNWGKIIPGLRPNYIKGSLNVIIAVDISKNRYGSTVRSSILNMLRLFNKRFARFSLVLVSRTSTISITNYYANSNFINLIKPAYQRMTAFIRRITFNRNNRYGPRYGAALNLIHSNLNPNLRKARRNILLFVAQDKSSDDLKFSASRLKKRGNLMSVLAIGNKYNIPELQAMASSGQLLAAGEISMLPIMLYRLQFAYSLAINGPKPFSQDISLTFSTNIRPLPTVFRAKNNDSPIQKTSIAAKNIFTSKRDEIITNFTTIYPLQYSNETNFSFNMNNT